MAEPTHRELFTGLLRELRATGPLGRLRLLGRGVGALRQLSPWDRKMLLRMAGFEGAETLIERLAAEDEQTAERLQRVLAEVERDPERSEKILRALADPHQRGEAIESLIDMLDRAPGPPAQPPPPSLPEDAPVPDLDGRAERPAAPAAAPQRAEAARVAAAATVAAAAAKAKATAEAEVESRPKPEARPVPPPPKPAVEPRPKPLAPKVAPPRLDDPPSLPVERGARGTLGTLLDLRRRLEEDGSVPADEIRALLSDSGVPRWARRRAVTAWIEEGRPDADIALAMIGDLGSATDRTWCLASLAASRSWPSKAWQKILEAAPDDTTRRRLERRRP